jgi:hypothetical protein
MIMSTAGLILEEDCPGEAQQQLKSTDPTSRQRGRPISETRNCLKVIKKEGEKLVAGSRWMPDTKTDWPTDRRSQYNFDFGLELAAGGIPAWSQRST